MMPVTQHALSLQPRPGLRRRFSVVVGAIGIVSYAVSLYGLLRVQFNVVTYASVAVHDISYWPATVFAFGILAAIVFAAIVGSRRKRDEHQLWKLTDSGQHVPLQTHKGSKPTARAFRELVHRSADALSQLWPLAVSLPVAGLVLAGSPPPFWTSLLMIVSASWAAFRVGAGVRWGAWLWRNVASVDPRRRHMLALGSLLLAMVVLTVVHTCIQINFFEHFMLGHADIGHYAEELHNALAGRGLRSDSFDNSRLGWHFVPLMYVLVPLYACWSSPVMLMVLGPLVLHVVALPLYLLTRRLTGSVLVGWMMGVAWLLHPSLSRLVYANTYGFQWVYFAMPLIALMAAQGLLGRWRSCLLFAALLLLCQETTAAVTFGWGIYMALFSRHRRTGVALAIGSVMYLVLCVEVIIPHFAQAGRYERFNLFGVLAATPLDLLTAPLTKPGIILDRLSRHEALYFMAVLLVTTALLPLRGWKVSIAALPTLVMTLLLQNAQWLNIKFWYQVPVLPLLFLAGIATMDRSRGRSRHQRRLDRAMAGKPVGRSRASFGLALAALIASAMGHLLYGYSPMSSPFAVYAHAESLHRPDPRMDVVRLLRSQIPRNATLQSTERLAAHFTDYRRLYTGTKSRDADFVLIDRSDNWDRSGLPQQADRFQADPAYDRYGEFGSIVVFVRREAGSAKPKE